MPAEDRRGRRIATTSGAGGHRPFVGAGAFAWAGRCLSAGAIATLLAGTAGCASSTDSGQATVPSFSATSESPPSAAPSSAPKPRFRTYTLTGINKEDVAVKAKVDLDPRWYSPAQVEAMDEWGSLLNLCSNVDPKRDVVRLASISLTAENNGFDTNTGVVASFRNADNESYDPYKATVAYAPSSIEYAVGYTEPSCASTKNLSLFFGVGAAVKASPSGSDQAAWGPVQVAFVVHGYKGPGHPKSNRELDPFLEYVTFGIGNSAPYDFISGSQASDTLPFWNKTNASGPKEVAAGLFKLS